MSTENFIVKEHTFQGCHIREYPGCTINQEEALELHVKQYTPRNQPQPVPPDAVTFIFVHGASMPKELYEPMWDEFLALENGFNIRSIWAADCASTSRSGIINEDKLSMDNSWMDYARDILMMVNHFRDQMPRPLVGVGHSMGGTVITHVAYLHPRLFTSLMFLDPVLQMRGPYIGTNGHPKGPLNYSVWREDVWPSREAAVRSCRGLMQGWDPRCKEKMAQYAFRDLPTRLYPDVEAVKNRFPDSKASDIPVTLATSKHQEVLSYMREKFSTYNQSPEPTQVPRDTHPDLDPKDPMFKRAPVYRPEVQTACELIPSLRPSCLWVLGGTTYLSLEELRERISVCGTGLGGSGGAAEGRVREVTLPGIGHLMTFQAVKATIEPCAVWMKDVMVRYREDEKIWKKRQLERGHLFLEEGWYQTIDPLDALMDKKQKRQLQKL